MPPNAQLQFAMDLARGAGQIALDFFGRVTRLTKTHAMTTDEAVTDADRACQRHIIAGLKKRFPNDGIIGEESDSGESITNQAGRHGSRVWVIDPIDGTNNFVSGFPNFAVCIGLLNAGVPVLGVVFDVCRDRMYCAAQGEGCWLGSQKLSALQSPLGPASIIMMTSNLLNKQGKCPEFMVRWLSQTEWKLRIIGSAALEAVQVTAGIAHAAVTMHGKLWDIAAPAALLLEAGALLTDLTGQPIFPFNTTGYTGAKVPFLAAAPRAHGELLEQIGRYP